MQIESYGKCPGCGQQINTVKAGHVTVDVPLGAKWNGISYICPSCNVILGVQVDPVALKTDIIEGLLMRLREAR